MRPAVAWLAAAIVALASSPAATASSYPALELNEIWAAADRIIFATVDDVRVEERDDEPWTVVTLEVDRVLAGGDATDDDGERDDDPVELSFLGGELPGGRALTVASMPRFDAGEEVLVAIRDDDALASPLVGFRQGLWRLTGAGLVDERGRALGVGPDGLARNGPATSLDEVLNAVGEAAEAAP